MARLVMPVSTVMVRLTKSASITRFMREVPMTIAVGRRQGAAAQGGTRAARHHLQLVLVAVLEDLRHVLGRARQHDGQRDLPIGGQRVSLERAPAFLLGDHAFERRSASRDP